ncbi:DUF1854 domain-containing protein [Archangium sp.]|uniref:cyanophycin metabolism-associated DUF1854 family protein n=1 Tax=Archangium sp. TaxID=1872627 RepID=UPI003899A045
MREETTKQAMAESPEVAARVTYLPPEGVKPPGLSQDARGGLSLMLPSGEVFTDVVPVRCFPFSEADGWISFCDERGREVFCLADPGLLPPKARALLDAELARREFVPVIRRIHGVSAGAEPTTWHVETDRGETRFLLPSEDNIRRLGPSGAVLTDTHGVRYRVADLKALDAHSRKILQRYL